MRTDGIFSIYQIQHKQKDGKWVKSSLDHFGYPDDFCPSNDCWQITGWTGTLVALKAKKALRWIRAKYPRETFRIIEVIVMQKTIPQDW